jgi:DNA-binding CsgD family transcriptional regulator/tetratricopeptide (TPR) repeat protein
VAAVDTQEFQDGPRSAGLTVRGGHVSPVLVGRADVLALAARRAGAARAGAGHLLFLAGEAGIGKTRVLGAITDLVTDQGFRVVRASAFPGDAEVAGGALGDFATDLQGSAAAPDAWAQIAERLHNNTVGDAYRQRRMLVRGLAESIISLGTGCGPIFVALEDMHWADGLTLDVVDRVARQVGGLPWLMVGTYRTDELYPRVPMRALRARLLTQRLAEEVRLTRLSRSDTAAMATAMRRAALPAEVIDTVFGRSDGIPLHVEEFLAAVTGTDVPTDVPDTLADAVRARAQELTVQARALADSASVIGRSFDLDILTALTGEAGEVIDAGLRELVDRFFVAPRSDRSTYEFRHALIRAALYADLAPHRRRDLHARTADAAAAAGFGDAFVSDHYEQANQPGQAYRHALAGAAAATAVSAHRESVELLRRAQRTAPAALSGADRAHLLTALARALAAIDDNTAAVAAYTEAYALRRGLGDDTGAAALVPDLVAARHLLGSGLDERAGLLRAALDIIAGTDLPAQHARARIHAELAAAYMLDRRLDEAIVDGEYAKTVAAGLDDDAVRWNIDATVGSVFVFAGRMDEGWRLLEDAISAASVAGSEAAAARGYRMLATSASVVVEYDRALHQLREGIGYAERTERFNDRHYMTAHLAHVLWATGDWPAADRAARSALADGRDGITTRITALHVLGYLALGRGDWLAADGHLGEASELGGQMGELQRISPAWWGLAETALRRGHIDESIEWCERGYAASATVRDAAYLFPYVLTGTRAYLAADNPTAARDWVERSTRPLLHRAIPGTLAAVHHAQGLLHLHGGQTGKAREALDTAAAGWDQRHRFWEGVQASIDQARCASRSRRPAAAAALARRAHERAAAAGATILLDSVARIPSPAGADHAADPTSTLTAREVEVARLVATGATNRQIAQTLFITPKTVATHVEHILTKLGATRRTQIATWAATRPAVDGRSR